MDGNWCTTILDVAEYSWGGCLYVFLLARRGREKGNRCQLIFFSFFFLATADVSLAQKLAEELQYEREAATQSGPPEFVKEFQAQGVWAIQDNPGADEITFERTFGNETIRLMFSIADLDANPEAEFDAENEGEAEAETEGEDGAPAQGSVTSTPIRVAISITKRGTPGAVSIDAVCQDGAFLIENASYYQDAEVATQLTAEADWKRRGLYLGPTFENLDPAVQDEFERYLDERGINESLGLFIPDYAEYKEQTVRCYPVGFHLVDNTDYFIRRNTFVGWRASRNS